ncbi:hypothetical protein M885DRAFT_553050 [Pelagophyceae sp. CCMP2097]|nr:hypothetical protein M885DRAFT_553050 [Pelagophyceae sp. CCMP2097]
MAGHVMKGECENGVETGLVGSWEVVSWNLAAINNNPFEYYMAHPNPRYGELMIGVESFVSNPGERDAPVHEIFTDAMEQELLAIMATTAKWDAEAISETHDYWVEHLRNRKIMSGFVQDASLGDKRLLSMPDRATNTLALADGSTACRPTVINMYEGELKDVAGWWGKWRKWFFEESLLLEGAAKAKAPFELLRPIQAAKYPAIEPHEEKISVPLQALCQAIFDAVMVHMINEVSPDFGWHPLKLEICKALSVNKVPRTVDILERQYPDAAFIALQEVGSRMWAALRRSALAKTHFLCEPLDKKAFERDQASLLMLRRDAFDVSSVSDVTHLVLGHLKNKKLLAPGDLYAATVVPRGGGTARRSTVVVASFHGDTDGLASIPIVEAVSAVAKELGLPLLFALDANCYTDDRAKPGSKLGWRPFIAAADELGLETCHDLSQGKEPPLSVYNARTYLQPQVQKAVPYSDQKTSKKTDRNPKDYVLVSRGTFRASNTGLDNTGNRIYDDAPFPTLSFPSDHGILRTTVEYVD